MVGWIEQDRGEKGRKRVIGEENVGGDEKKRKVE